MSSGGNGNLPGEIAQGQRAHLLLNDPMLVEGFATLERQYIDAWKNTMARDTDARERFWLGVVAINAMRRHLNEIVGTGKLANIQMENERREQA